MFSVKFFCIHHNFFKICPIGATQRIDKTASQRHGFFEDSLRIKRHQRISACPGKGRQAQRVTRTKGSHPR